MRKQSSLFVMNLKLNCRFSCNAVANELCRTKKQFYAHLRDDLDDTLARCYIKLGDYDSALPLLTGLVCVSDWVARESKLLSRHISLNTIALTGTYWGAYKLICN